MVLKFSGKVSAKSENCRTSEIRTIQPKIPEITGGKSNGTEFPLCKCLIHWAQTPWVINHAIPFQYLE